MGEDDGRRDAPPLSGNSVDFASPTAFESGPLDAAKTSSAASRGVDGDIGAAAAERAELRDRPRCARRTEVMSFDSRIVPLTLVPQISNWALRASRTPAGASSRPRASDFSSSRTSIARAAKGIALASRPTRPAPSSRRSLALVDRSRRDVVRPTFASFATTY